MTNLPASLSIALWLVSSLWLVAIIAYVLDAPSELVWGAFIFGLVTGLIEWLAFRGNKR